MDRWDPGGDRSGKEHDLWSAIGGRGLLLPAPRERTMTSGQPGPEHYWPFTSEPREQAEYSDQQDLERLLPFT